MVGVGDGREVGLGLHPEVLRPEAVQADRIGLVGQYVRQAHVLVVSPLASRHGQNLAGGAGAAPPTGGDVLERPPPRGPP
ncbi:hypothetical protein GCM10023328_28500 [Modestobacter marinus]|uniref:Uncharacterized protein n=1 Tax=Modestobacter marinus TaxID=477641 RepID=A0ABQ2G1R7_9ACTN|nr:hypothetical protein GCM10011589_29220 [Modestobacter marinus]